ncbi:hypothetical protein PLEOSDRAFT_165609 [Pleurotus ostreatus PC15]|uniref:Uncharacterized protein n=1 Tax=Pleurotus ostreatus (strain PC15) TaxID=1137138 RepID=A0A067NWL9_PLEO1|nr:hypothetical protein PLEOSDRAFT_165609 [Pleurotus ostreatus PC15]
MVSSSKSVLTQNAQCPAGLLSHALRAFFPNHHLQHRNVFAVSYPLVLTVSFNVASPEGSTDRTSLGKRQRSISWDATQSFSGDSGRAILAGVLRSWDEAKQSCKLILEYSDITGEEEEEAYMLFLEEREAMAREMLAKVACAKLKWGAVVDGMTLEVMEAYVADNMDEFSEEDLENTSLSARKRKQKELGVGGGTGQANDAGVGAGAGEEQGGGEEQGAGAEQGGGEEPGGGEEQGGGGVGGDNGARPPKKPRKAKVPIIEQLSYELSAKIDDVNMAGYEAVEDRFRCVYTHVGAVHGKLTERDLLDSLHGYCHKPKHKSFLEEEALARLIVGYGDINMERLSEKERVNESEKESVNLLEGIFLTMAGLRLAIDRSNVSDTDEGRRWKKKQSDDLFELQYGAALAHVPVFERKGKEHTWRKRWIKAHEKMVTRRNKVLALFKALSDDEFGCIVLLDPLWSPTETSSSDFHQLHACVLDNILKRRRRADDDAEGDGDVPWHTGNDVGNRRMLVEVVRYFTTDAMARFIDETVDKLEEDASEIAV